MEKAKREFTLEDGTKYYIHDPTAEDIRGADWQYSKTYTNCLVEGITTAAEMSDILMRRGIIGPEYERRARELEDDLRDKITQLEMADDVEEKRVLAIEVMELREELFQWNQRFNGPMGNTCEQISDDARLEYLTSCMVRSEDGNRVWETYEDYLNDVESGTLPSIARYEVMLFLQGLDSDFMENTPEAVAFKEIEEDLLKRAKEAEEALKEVPEKAPKKTTKSKATKKRTKKSE